MKLTEPASGRRISLDTAAHLLPYDRTRVTPGMVHLGIGAFHRAHVAEYIDNILKKDPAWGIVGASLRRPDTRKALEPQDFLYTLAVRSGEGTKTRVIGSLLDVLDASTQRIKLIEAMADPRIRIVSLTVTEKGYCHDPATGNLDPDHADIRHDLTNPEAPVSAPGLLVRALELRRSSGHAPFTVLCCDNLPSNGETTARVVIGLSALRSKSLADYISAEVAFPSTMVDRIVPATTAEDRRLVLEATGFEDAWPVVTEPFSQWVIEDRFSAGRPLFESVGAEMVSDVKPFELMKLRMLNGSHSTLAYLGYLAGFEFVSQAISNPYFRALIHDLMSEEVMATLPMGHVQLSNYRDALLIRFANPAIKHRTWQIAMDGSQKLPQRLLGTIRDRLERNLPVRRTALGVAAWMRYVSGIDERGNAIEVKDPFSERLKDIAVAAHNNPASMVDGYLGVREVFGRDLPQSETFRNELVRHLQSLFEHGAIQTAQSIVS
ncbi:MAG TPA: mannitol dehydrogenase family protein [Aestuariivirga sp.]